MHFRLLFGFICISIFASGQQLRVEFATGSYTLSKSSIDSVIVFAKNFAGCNYQFVLQGRTDNAGSETSNVELSRLRAEAVRELIITAGKDTNQIKMEWFGESNPLQANDDESGRSVNRSVLLSVVSAICDSAGDADDIELLYQKIKDEGQQFCIDPSKDTAIVGLNGTIVYYRPDMFKTNSCQCITLVLHEFFQPSSMILNNLTTTSNGRPLESAGMVKLEGYCDKNPLQYQGGRSLIVFIPTDSVLPGMKLLTANRAKMSEILDWKMSKDELQFADAQRLSWYCRWKNGKPQKCHLFFCKIKRMLTSRSKQEKQLDRLNEDMAKEEAFINQYAFDEKQLGDALQKSKSASPNLLKYYVYKNANWDYHNIDRYLSGQNQVDFIVQERYITGTDVKLVYTENKTVLPSTGKQNYLFQSVSDQEAIWIIGLKNHNDTAYLAMEKSYTHLKKCALTFVPENIEAFKSALKRID